MVDPDSSDPPTGPGRPMAAGDTTAALSSTVTGTAAGAVVLDTTRAAEDPGQYARGSTLGRFLVLDPIGAGGMGMVGADTRDGATVIDNLGLVLQHRGEHARAQGYFERSLAIRERLLGADHPDVAVTLHHLGAGFLALRRFAPARARLERALAIREARDVDGYSLAETEAALAHALWEADGDRTRAVTLARRALERFTALGPTGEDERARVAGWLKRHVPAAAPK